jgi:putative Mg2+ transporter-C (MgtC) family protein
LGDFHALLPTPWVQATSIIAAFLSGAIVGIEREKGHKPAGLRTQILICLGSAIFTIVSMSSVLGRAEPARVAAQIVTGVGFLGAGSILRDRYQITGLTTAATIWTVSAIGIMVGAGYVGVGILLSVSVMLVLSSFRKVEVRMAGRCTTASLLLVYRIDHGKTRHALMGIFDEAHGPLHVGDEVIGTDDTARITIRYCKTHREHRGFLPQVAALPTVVAMEADHTVETPEG